MTRSNSFSHRDRVVRFTSIELKGVRKKSCVLFARSSSVFLLGRSQDFVLETRVNTTSLNDFARQSHCITWKLVPPWPKRSQTEFSLGYSGNCAIAVFANLESRDACSPLDRETNIPYRIFFSFFSLLIFFSLRSNRIVATRVTRGGGGSWPELKKFRATITRSVGRSVGRFFSFSSSSSYVRVVSTGFARIRTK